MMKKNIHEARQYCMNDDAFSSITALCCMFMVSILASIMYVMASGQQLLVEDSGELHRMKLCSESTVEYMLDKINIDSTVKSSITSKTNGVLLLDYNDGDIRCQGRAMIRSDNEISLMGYTTFKTREMRVFAVAEETNGKYQIKEWVY